MTPAEPAAAPADAAADCAASARRNAAMRIRSLLSDSSLSRPAAVLPLVPTTADPMPPPPLESARDLPEPIKEAGEIKGIRVSEVRR